MEIDLYLAFTFCDGNCIFCRKGNGLIQFTRPDYSNNATKYQYFLIETPEEAFLWLENMDISEIDKINISGNDPIEWKDFSLFLEKLHKKYPKSHYTLRISNTYLLSTEILDYFHKFQFSIYGSNSEIHNQIVGNDQAWDILHENIQVLKLHNKGEQVFLHTIIIRENSRNIGEIMRYIDGLDNPNPIKIVYPHFMPKKDMTSLLSRKEVITLLLEMTARDFLYSRCILVNFRLGNSILKNYFYGTQE